ncbi:MAG: radical SAM protein, partial [bacterium]|nr:radical SAM protein [bacterium]
MVASLPATDPTRIGTVPPGTPPPAGIRKLHLILIRPSKYDDDGYVMRYVRGVLPSNTLATLAALTEEAAEAGELGDIEIEIRMMDEFVQKIDPRRLARRFNRHGARPVVALCGVQTNQFPRAADLAREFRAAGLTVMMGGFHVSGSIAMSPGGAIPPECQALIDAGVTLVKGEVEETWGDLLRDALHGRLKPFYDITARPDLSRANIPVVDPKLMKRFAYPYMGTIDAGRGCPMNCSFCTIINVQGRKMRYRLAEK